MKQISILLFVLCLIAISEKTSAQQKYDIFPLSNKLHYSYSFYQAIEEWEFSTLFYRESDSGKVEYIIRDSIRYGDTLIVWNVEQRENLLHKRNDSVYFIIDTINFSIYEVLKGNHELKCNSMVWLFPLKVWPYGFIITSPDSSIYRYSDSSKVLYTLSNPDPAIGWKDSIWFSVEDGMSQRITNSYSIHIGRWYYTLNVKQIGKPTEVEQKQVGSVFQFILFQNYPNPFNPSTTIKYSLISPSIVKLELFDCLGRKLFDLDNGYRTSGEHIVKLNLDHLSSGIYFYKMHTDNYSATKKLVLLK
jgi:hypothetical protein